MRSQRRQDLISLVPRNQFWHSFAQMGAACRQFQAALRPATPSGHNKAVAIVAMFVSCDHQHLLEADPSSMRVRPFVDVLLWSSFFEDARHSTTMSNLTGVSPVSYQPPAAPQSLLCARHRWMGFNSTKISNISARQMPVTKRAAGQGRYLMG